MTAASTGMAHVFVDGVETLIEGEATGARPGHVLALGARHRHGDRRRLRLNGPREPPAAAAPR